MIWLLWGAVVSGCLLLIGHLCFNVKRHIVDPYVWPFVQGAMSGFQLPPESYQVGISLGLTVLLLAASIAVLLRRFRAWERFFADYIFDTVKAPFEQRLTRIENNTPDYEGTITNLNWLKEG